MTNPAPTPRLLCFREVREILGGIGRRTVDGMERRGEFPRRVRLTSKSVRWIESEVAEFITNRRRA